MITEREQKLVNWLRTRKVATRRQLQHQFQVCHMTVFRTLKKVGYLASYNHNAGFYTLADVPQFDDWGLWAYRDVRFSRAGTLLDTLVALASQAPAGLTADELEERLQTPVANLLSRLVQHGRLPGHRGGGAWPAARKLENPQRKPGRLGALPLRGAPSGAVQASANAPVARPPEGTAAGTERMAPATPRSPLGVGPGGLARGPSRRGQLGRHARPRGLVGLSLLDSRLPQRRSATRLPLRSVPVVLAAPIGEGRRGCGSAALSDPGVLSHAAGVAQLREVLRLSAEQMDQLRQPQQLPPDEQPAVKRALEQLREELRQQTADRNDSDGPLAQIALKHLDRYWGHLVPEQSLAAGECWQRTTNQLESDWGGLKRRRRRTHGRGKLTRDFQTLPEEYLLVLNLENETYLQMVLVGSLESLPAKLAEASREGGSFDAWRRQRRPRLVGELPRRLLREEGFVDHLLDACIHYCQFPAPPAA